MIHLLPAAKSEQYRLWQTSFPRFRRGVSPSRIRSVEPCSADWPCLCLPLLTVLIIVWAINTTKSYFLNPSRVGPGKEWCGALADIREGLAVQDPVARTALADHQIYQQLDNGTFIPQSVYEYVQRQPGESPPTTGRRILPPLRRPDVSPALTAVPFFLALFVLLLYFLGKFMAAGIGRFFGGLWIGWCCTCPAFGPFTPPSSRSATSSSPNANSSSRGSSPWSIPRKGVWSMGFVTSEGLACDSRRGDEPVLAVLIPYSPLPMTGCTITVRKSECIDLNITFDQACQFIVSCGVVVPPHTSGRYKRKMPKRRKMSSRLCVSITQQPLDATLC